MFFPWFEVWVWLLTSAVAFGVMVAWGIAGMRYRLGQEALEIVVLGVPFRSIPYTGIEAAERGGSLWNEHWVTFRLGNRVTLHLREGGRVIVITPPDPPAFLRELESRMNERGPRAGNG
jgi:hypothetical protein